MKLPHNYSPGEKVRDIYTGKISTVSKSYWQWYAGPPTSDYTIEFAEGGWNKSTNLEPVTEYGYVKACGMAVDYTTKLPRVKEK